MADYVILVNENDEEIGQEEKLRAHELGLCHRAFSVFIFRNNSLGKTELLLQQRQLNKYHSGGLWSNTCCSHPRPGENIIEAGERRLREEMNLDIKLKEVGMFHYVFNFANGLTENEVDHLLIGDYHNEVIAVNLQEVKDYRWIDLESLFEDLRLHSDRYTPWLVEALKKVEICK